MNQQEGRIFCYTTINNTVGALWAMKMDNMQEPKEPQTADNVELCPMPDIAKLIGGKWKLIVLQILIFRGTKRFNELRRMIDGITQTMLTNQLRALEADGLVTRVVYAEVPPRVEYTATPRAVALTKMFHAMHEWWVNGEQ